ncbi:MAG: CdaR family protein [Armatimonadota bacterium]
MIRHNLFYKLLALGVAVGLFLYVNAEQNPRARKTYTVPLTAGNVAKGYVAEISQDEASVTISGLKSVMDSIQRVTAVVDLSSATPSFGRDEKTFKIKANVFGVAPADLDNLDIKVSPQSVRVRIEALSGKKLPVEVKFPAAPPLGYSYSNPVLIPGSVSVSGKSTEVSLVKRVVLTLPNRFSDQSIDDYFALTPLDSSGSKVEDVTLSPEKVRLKIELVEVPATKTVIVSPNIQGDPKYPAKVNRVTAVPASVTIMGKPSALAAISTITTDRVSIEGASDTVTSNVDLRVPPGAKVSGHGSARITVYIGAHD